MKIQFLAYDHPSSNITKAKADMQISTPPPTPSRVVSNPRRPGVTRVSNWPFRMAQPPPQEVDMRVQAARIIEITRRHWWPDAQA
jgi:hypothetical protein